MDNNKKLQNDIILHLKEINNILSVDDLKIGYKTNKGKKEVLDGINISANKGDLIAVIGQNGVGKSTLLRSISKLQETLGGSISISGIDINQISRANLAKSLSYVSTEVLSVNNLKVFDLVALGRFPYTGWFGKLDKKDRHIIYKSLCLVGMEKYADKFVSEISDGERQRVMIARTLSQDTDIIVLDEPTAFLDLRNKYELVNILNNLTKEKDKTIIFSTHDLNIALQEADKLWLMLPDKIIEGSPEDLILGNNISDIFGESKLKFDNITGDFKIDKIKKGFIGLIGDSSLEIDITNKALSRLGYNVLCNKKQDVNVIVKRENNNILWILEKDNKQEEFNSIYYLSKMI